MRTTVTIDDTLYDQALALADDNMKKTDLFEAAIKAFIESQAAKRQIALLGKMPDLQPISRRGADIDE